MEFSGRTAIVTGAGTGENGVTHPVGIGFAVAKRLAAAGCRVMLTDIDESKLRTAVEQLRALGYTADGTLCDVSDEAAVNAMAERTRAVFGPIDILINNAGIYQNSWQFFVDMPSSVWKQKIEVNINGTLYCTHAVLPEMIERKFGRIVNIGSVAAVYGLAHMADYSMTKGAVVSFTKALAKEVSADGVLVNCVSPGNIDPDPQHAPAMSFVNRSGTPDECASLIVYLASPENTYVSGQNIQSDGCRRTM